MRFSLFCTLAMTTLLLTGCGDSHEKVVKDQIALMSDMNSVLEGVTDKASAEAAKPRLEKIAAKMKEVEARAKEMGDPDDATEKALKEKYESQIEEQAKKLMGHMFRLMMDQEAGKVIQDSMKGVGGGGPGLMGL